MFTFLSEMFGLDKSQFDFGRVMKIYHEYQSSKKAGLSEFNTDRDSQYSGSPSPSYKYVGKLDLSP